LIGETAVGNETRSDSPQTYDRLTVDNGGISLPGDDLDQGLPYLCSYLSFTQSLRL